MSLAQTTDAALEEAYVALPPAALELRRLVLETAAATPGVGPVEEALKWGQPAFLTPKTKAGSTLRIGVTRSGELALFAHCQTSIISDFRALFETDFTFDGNRAVHLKDGDLPVGPLRTLIASALTYHLRKRA